MSRHLVTYFDKQYAACGIVMIESLLHWRPDARIAVLCYDDEVAAILSAELDERVSPVLARTIAEFEPRLPATRAGRTPWEYYATHKPASIAWVLQQTSPDSLVAFIDADTMFYSDPDPLFAAAASVAVSPHRFHPATQHLAIFGPYNAGFGLWRNDSVGRQCLRDWNQDCLEWCHCRVEGERFMNQGYLGRWPSRYPRCVVLDHPGHNLAPWNVGSHRLTSGPEGVLVDGQPLIFFHFSCVNRTSSGDWETMYGYEELRQPVVLQDIYAPYLRRLETVSARLVDRHGISGLGSVRSRDPAMPWMNLTRQISQVVSSA